MKQCSRPAIRLGSVSVVVVVLICSSLGAYAGGPLFVGSTSFGVDGLFQVSVVAMSTQRRNLMRFLGRVSRATKVRLFSTPAVELLRNSASTPW